MEQIVKIEQNQMSSKSDDVFNSMAKSGNWLPRLQLFGSKTKEAGAGKIQINHYGIVLQKENIADVGLEVDVIPCAWRPCGIRIHKDGVDNYFDQNTDDFKKVMADSETQDSGCFYGLQFLLYVPLKKMFVTFLFGTKSSRPEAGNMRPLIGKMATLKSRLASNTRFNWQTPVVIECSTEPSSVPSPEELQTEIEKFNNPPVSAREKAEQVSSEAAGREQ